MSATFGCVALLVQIVANLKVPFLRYKRDDDLPPLMAPPSEWLQQLKLDGVKHDAARNSYLSLLRGVLSGMFFLCDTTIMSASEYEDCVHVLTDGHAFGRALSLHAVTMAGHRRMRSVQELVQLVARRKVNGSYAETGVWRGGMSIFATAALQLYGLGHRPVYLCDSFNGVPLPRNTSVRTDETAYRIQWYLHVNELHVQKMFQKYGVWSPSVHMVKGFYVHSMPPFRAELQQRGERLAILRLDGDIYDSTVDVLYNLYDLVEVGGFVVIDDFGWGGVGDKHVYGARDATLDFRYVHGIEDDDHVLHRIDANGAWFRKARHVTLQRERYLHSLNASSKREATQWLRPAGTPYPRGAHYLALRKRWEDLTANESVALR